MASTTGFVHQKCSSCSLLSVANYWIQYLVKEVREEAHRPQGTLYLHYKVGRCCHSTGLSGSVATLLNFSLDIIYRENEFSSYNTYEHKCCT